VSVTFTPIRLEHLLYIKPRAVQSGEHKALLTPQGSALVESSIGLTGWHGARCLGVAGIFSAYPGRAEAWSLLDEEADAYVLPIMRKARFVISAYSYRRLEMVVKVDNEYGHRIARLLGFGEPEGVLKCGHVDGSDIAVYAKVNRQWQQ
jgi:hypothetical protein